MKKLFIVLFFLQTFSVYPYDAIIIVLEAPLLKEPNLNSIVLQTLRKGTRVYVPNEIGNLDLLPEFIQTYDRVGNIAYIPQKYVKIITNDLNENKMPLRYSLDDPTDYRLEEPIPGSYPFDNSSYFRTNFAFTMGNNLKSPFDYNSIFTKQSFSSESGVRISLAHKVNFDKYDRFYFGILGMLTTSLNSIQFLNENQASEKRNMIRIGPFISFDAFKNSDYRLTFGSGLTYNFHKSHLEINGPSGAEEKTFSGLSISPMANTFLQILDVIPKADLIMGTDVSLFLPSTQTSKDQTINSELWAADSSSQISSNLKPQVSFFLGFQIRN